MARWVAGALLLTAVFFIPSDTLVERKIDAVAVEKDKDLDVLGKSVDFLGKNADLAALAALTLPDADRAATERRSDPAVEMKSEPSSDNSLPLPYIVYYAYTEVPLNPKPIDVVSDSMADLPLGSCRDEVKRAADVFGLSYSVMMAFAIIESSCQAGQRTGSYIGLYQLSQYEFNRFGRTGGDIYNPRDNALAAAHKFVVDAIDFQHAVGRYPTPFDRYCIHQQGLEGCIQHQAQPERVAWQSMCATQEGKTKGEKWCRRAIWGNVPSTLKRSIAGGVEMLTSGGFLEIWRGRVAHFTKMMTGISEAHAATLAITERPMVAGPKPSIKQKIKTALKKKQKKKVDTAVAARGAKARHVKLRTDKKVAAAR